MKKVAQKLLVGFLMITMILTGSGFTKGGVVQAATTDDEVELQILATSDLHGRFVPYDYAVNAIDSSGSLAQIATVVNQMRDENPNTLLLDVGDTIQDNSSDLFLEDSIHPMIAGMNALHYDAWTLGNHEFNYGMNPLLQVMDQFEGTVLSGNVYNADGTYIASPYKVFEKDGVKIAVIGMVTPNITRWDATNLKDYKVTNPVEETKKIVDKIKNEVDVIIASVHMSESNEYDVQGSGVEDLANACPEIDLILAAHEHKAVEGAYYNNVLTVENKNGGQTMAQVNITLEKKSDGSYTIKDRTSKLIKVSDYQADASMVKALSSYDKKAKSVANEVIGKLEGGNLVSANEINGIPQAQIEESAMINLINEVQMYYTEAQVSAAAVFNTSANLLEGDIKKSDTALIYKYSNTLYKLEMTGAQLKKYMEWSAAYYNTYKEGDLTISFNPDIRAFNYDMFSGVNYEVNISKEVGSRIENLTWPDGTSIKSNDVITIAVNNYRANSQLLSYGPVYQEGEALPKLLEIDVKGEIGGVRELIGDYITNVKKGVITPELSGNWKITGNDWDESLHAQVAALVAEGKVSIPVSEDGRTPNVAAITKADIEDYVIVTAPEKSTIQSVYCQLEDTFTIQWKETKGAERYILFYSTDKNFKKGNQAVTTGQTSFTVASAKGDQTYYVKVCAYKSGLTGEKLYGEWSTVKKVTVE